MQRPLMKMLRSLSIIPRSKNEEENALSGLNHPEGVLRPEDFAIIKANWEPKSKNLIDTANALSILPDAMVFADDNPAEREIVRAQVKGAAVPELTEPENYIRIIDRAGYFEVLTLSDDDRKRNQMMQENLKREALQATFADYGEYLTSLAMQAEIKPFDKLYFPRITQLTNKSNQFNLTTRRYTQDEIAHAAEDADCITLYGKLADKMMSSWRPSSVQVRYAACKSGTPGADFSASAMLPNRTPNTSRHAWNVSLFRSCVASTSFFVASFLARLPHAQ